LLLGLVEREEQTLNFPHRKEAREPLASIITVARTLNIARSFLKCQQNITNGTHVSHLNSKFICFTLTIAFSQVKHFRALQEQARTYLDLLCSMCDLSNSSVKNTAKDIQQTEQMVK
jgi:hypothetical protein